MTEVIELENVSKKFIICHEKKRSFQDLFVSRFKGNGSREEFWALRDVNLTIQRGETVGIIGENGSGKSTLLKLITRIFDPTYGRVSVCGRVSALLELGAGFHPELTGKENIFLNGSILGLGRREMRRKFGQIVEFSELERFIDTPVKHYSSGMYMRLAFSIAMSVDPEIMLVDEILAVGDEAFQHKCLAKIRSLRRSQVTVVFVSHTLGTMDEICDRVAWIENGRIKQTGTAKLITDTYLLEVQKKEKAAMEGVEITTPKPDDSIGDAEASCRAEHLPTEQDDSIRVEQASEPIRWGSGEVRIDKVRFLDAKGNERHVFECGDTVKIQMDYSVKNPVDDIVFGYGIFRDDGTRISASNSYLDGIRLGGIDNRGTVTVAFESLHVLSGVYYVEVAAHAVSGTPYDYRSWKGHEFTFSVLSLTSDRGLGVVHLERQWQIGTALPLST